MSHSPLPLVIEDMSAFATTLRKSWPKDPPGHAQTLALIAKAAGYRNHQHLKADVPPDLPLDASALKRVADALRVFDAQARLLRWPKKTSVRGLCLIWIWSRIPARRALGEPDINGIIQQNEGIGDYVMLRRALVDEGLLRRTPDGRTYHRQEKRPSDEARAVIRALSERAHFSPVVADGEGSRPDV